MASLIEKATSLLARALKADIVKVFSLTSISTLVKMCTGLISVKIVAAIIGPAGVALLGQLSNFSIVIMSFSCGGINSGITKYIAEYKSDESKVADYISTALRIIVLCSLLCGTVMILFHNWISKFIMLSDEYGYVFIIFGITVLLYALNSMLTSIVNGYKDFKKFVCISIANSIMGVIFTVILVLCWHLKGALIAAVTYQSVMFFITLWMLRNSSWLKWNFFKRRLSKVISSKYFKYTMMTLTTALTLPIAQMFLRGYVMTEISTVEAGWWEGMNRISNMYLMVITSSFVVYYLPRLSEITNTNELRCEIIKTYKVISPLIFCGFLVVYISRYLIVNILFTSEFLPMTELFLWQLIGDFFKVSSWVLAFIMQAKAMAKIYIITEIVATLMYIGFGYVFAHINGIVGICQAYIINYIIYTIILVVLFRRILFIRYR